MELFIIWARAPVDIPFVCIIIVIVVCVVIVIMLLYFYCLKEFERIKMFAFVQNALNYG